MAGRGTRREHDVRKLREREGWWAVRASNSRGDADVVCLRAGYRPQFIEVKSNIEGGPFMNFRKADRKELSDAAAMADADAILCYWPPRKPPRFIFEKDWPSHE